MIIDYIKKKFGLLSEKLKNNSSRSHKNYEPKVLKAYNPAIKKLERLISRSDLINTGRVHLLELDKLKQKLGKKWPELREGVLDNLYKIITKRIDTTDVFFSRSDEEHIIVFSHASNHEALLITAKILQDLSEIYLGSADTCEIIVKTAIGTTKGKLQFKSMSLDEIFDEITYSEVSAGSDKNYFEDDNDPKWNYSEKEAPYEVVFKPIWDSNSEIISTYMVNSRSFKWNKKIKLGYDVLTDPTCVEAKVKMDCFIMTETIEIMDDLFLNKFRAIFSIPVCYETVFNSDRLKKFLLHCQAIPQVLRKYVSFTLLDFPAGVPQTKLRFIVSSLTGYSRAIVITCGKIPQNISYYKNCGIKGICLSVPEKITNPPEYWEQLAIFVQKCKQQHIYTSLENINQEADLMLARDISIGFLSGDIIGPYSDIPGHMSRVSWKELIAK